MYVNKKSKRKSWSLLAFLMVLSLGIWACTGNTGSQAGDDQTEATTEEASTNETSIENSEGNEHPSEHPEGEEHPSEHPEGEHPAADTTAQDSTKHSEHPEGEHPKN